MRPEFVGQDGFNRTQNGGIACGRVSSRADAGAAIATRTQAGIEKGQSGSASSRSYGQGAD
jgi:hypothetical protein